MGVLLEWPVIEIGKGEKKEEESRAIRGHKILQINKYIVNKNCENITRIANSWSR